MTSPVRLIRHYPLLSFVFLACLFGWWSYIAAAFGLGSDPGNNPLGPLVAALVVAGGFLTDVTYALLDPRVRIG